MTVFKSLCRKFVQHKMKKIERLLTLVDVVLVFSIWYFGIGGFHTFTQYVYVGQRFVVNFTHFAALCLVEASIFRYTLSACCIKLLQGVNRLVTI